MGGARGWGGGSLHSLRKEQQTEKKLQKGQSSFNSRGQFLLGRQEETTPDVPAVGGLQGMKALEDTKGRNEGF